IDGGGRVRKKLSSREVKQRLAFYGPNPSIDAIQPTLEEVITFLQAERNRELKICLE
ncbi:Hypothetical predicted protein, partial [Pelobates cultripes]